MLYILIKTLESITSYSNAKCHLYIILKSLTSLDAKKYQSCIVLERVNLILLIKTMSIYIGKYQFYTIYK